MASMTATLPRPTFDDSGDLHSLSWLPPLNCVGARPEARCSQAACGLDDATSFVIIGGGVCDPANGNAWRHFGDVWQFDALHVTWKRLDGPETSGGAAALEFPSRRGHAAAYCPKRKAIVVFGGTCGGVDGDGLFSDTWIFSLLTQQWTQPPIEGPVPSARRGHSGWFDKGEFFVLGGYVERGDRYPFDPHCWCLNLETWRWARKPYGRSQVKLASTGELREINARWLGPEFALTVPTRVDRHLYFFGGCSPMDPSATNIIYRLNLDTFCWLACEVKRR
jgi:hypothetical protein